jgi:hypothetical protein
MVGNVGWYDLGVFIKNVGYDSEDSCPGGGQMLEVGEVSL